MKTSKKVNIIIGIIVAVIIGLIFLFCLFNRGHRLIAVESVTTNVKINRDAKDISVVEGMKLISNDYVSVDKEEGECINLLVDDDKHVSAYEGAEFEIVSVGNPNKGRIDINQKSGKIACAIDNKLNGNSYFLVNTPNCSLSVRGTIFESSYDEDYNKTDLKVDEGIVNVQSGDNEQDVNAGESISVIGEDIYNNNSAKIRFSIGFDNWDYDRFYGIFVTKYNGGTINISLRDEFYQFRNAMKPWIALNPWRVIEKNDNLDKLLNRFKEMDDEIINPNMDMLQSYYDSYTNNVLNGEILPIQEKIDLGIEYLTFYDDYNAEVRIPVYKIFKEPMVNTIPSSASSEPNVPYYIDESDNYVFNCGVSLYFEISPEYYDILSDTLHLEQYKEFE